MSNTAFNTANIFQNRTTNSPFSDLDTNFSNIASYLNSTNNYENYFTDSGSVNAYVVSIASPITFTLAAGAMVSVKINNTNTGASTLNVGGTGAKSIIYPSGTAISANALPAGAVCKFIYDGSAYQLQTISSLSAVAAQNVSVRQTVLYGAQTSAGAANMLSAGTGLALNLSATLKPMVIAFAGGVSDNVSTLNADVTSVVSGLAASNTSYITTDYVSGTSVTWGKTLAPPQYGLSYNQVAQSALSLNNKSTDDFGNSWTNTSVTFSNTTPKFAGSYYGVFNGTTSRITSSAFTTLGNGSWTLRCAFNSSNVTVNQVIFNAGDASNEGVYIGVSASKLILYLSSTGSTWDIANALAGNTTLTNNTWYDLEITYDAVAGKYYTYLNGTAESNFTITSTLRICVITGITVGASQTSASFFSGSIQGFEFLPYCLHSNGTAFTPQTALSDVTVAGYASNYFSVPDMVMYSVTGASALAGTNPTFTAINRVYPAECVTGAASVSSVTNYQLRVQRDYLSSGLGYAQTWQSVTRVAGTTYYNTTAKPIVVSFTISTTSGINQGSVLVNSNTVYSWNNGSTSFYSLVQIIIPPGNSYIYNNTNNSPFLGWVELR